MGVELPYGPFGRKRGRVFQCPGFMLSPSPEDLCRLVLRTCCARPRRVIGGEVDFRVSGVFLPGFIFASRVCPADRLLSGASFHLPFLQAVQDVCVRRLYLSISVPSRHRCGRCEGSLCGGRAVFLEGGPLPA